MKLTPKELINLQHVAANAYADDPYGNGKHDWQSAEVAVGERLIKLGVPEEEAWEQGKDIASEVVSAIEDGTRKCTCDTCRIMENSDDRELNSQPRFYTR